MAHEPHHVFRAIIEGIGFGTRAILDAFRTGGHASTEITVGGGAAQSALWMQIHADTAELPVRLPASADAPSTGSAVLASHGAGRFASIDEEIAAMVLPGTTIDPRPREMAMYDEIYRRYLALYPALTGGTGMIREHDMTGRLALVTGGAAGIGRAICEVLAEAGSTVVVADRDVAGAAALAETLGGHALDLDVTDAAAAENAAADLAARHGPPEVLVNNAGFVMNAPALDMIWTTGAGCWTST